jgi:hypothetical protein
MAASRRGKQRGPYRVHATKLWEWTPGNLSPSGRHISVTSAEREVLEVFLRCVDRRAKISRVKGGYGTEGFQVQICDVGLYRWLQSIGLTPRKSLTLGAIGVPGPLLPHLLRGLIDGDGSILDVTYDGTGKARGRRYRTLLVRFNTASRDHVDWVRQKIKEQYGLVGGLWCEDGLYQLTYGKGASLQLLPLIYTDETVPCLARKREVWRQFLREGGRVKR